MIIDHKIMALQEYSKEAIAEIFIIGGMGFCAVAVSFQARTTIVRNAGCSRYRKILKLTETLDKTIKDIWTF